MSNIILLDSAMGSELINRGESLPKHIWSAYVNTNNPDLVYQIHSENIDAGAQVIITNTFRTTPRAYIKTGLNFNNAIRESRASLDSAINMAHMAATKDILVLGSIAPLEDCYQPKLFPGEEIAYDEFVQIGHWLYDGGVDGIIIETMNNIAETVVALEALDTIKLPIYVSYGLRTANKLLSGESLSSAISILNKYEIEGLLLNCSPIKIMSNAVDNIVNIYSGKWGIYPNLGIGQPPSNGEIKAVVSDEIFLMLMQKAKNNHAKFLGGCCGSSPHHIKLLNNLIVNNL